MYQNITHVLGIIIFDYFEPCSCYKHNMLDFGGFGVVDDPCDVGALSIHLAPPTLSLFNMAKVLLSIFLKKQEENLKISLQIHSLGACKRLQKQRQEITLNLQITPIVMK